MTYTHHNAEIETITQEYDAKITEEKIKEALIQKHGWHIVEPENKAKFDDEAYNYTQAHFEEAKQKIAAVQEDAKNCLAAAQKSYEALSVKLLSGTEIAENYAKKHGIDIDKATAKLEAYAKVKQYSYDPNNLADQYAVLFRNDSDLSEYDRQMKTDIIKGYSARQNTAKACSDHLLNIVNNHPLGLMNETKSSGYAMLKLMSK